MNHEAHDDGMNHKAHKEPKEMNHKGHEDQE